MSKQENKFAASMDSAVAALVKSADVHTATHTTVFKADAVTMPEGITPESLVKHVSFINETSAAVPAAVAEIALANYEETKHEKWDGVLELAPGLSLTGGVQLREEVDGNTTFGTIHSLVDHHYSPELTDWMTGHQADLATKASKLFD